MAPERRDALQRLDFRLLGRRMKNCLDRAHAKGSRADLSVSICRHSCLNRRSWLAGLPRSDLLTAMRPLRVSRKDRGLKRTSRSHDHQWWHGTKESPFGTPPFACDADAGEPRQPWVSPATWG